jgi:hypothetical protein
MFATVLRTYRADDIVFSVLEMARAVRKREMPFMPPLVIPCRPYPSSGPTPIMERGTALERRVLELVASTVGLPVLPGQVYHCDHAPYIRVSLDGEVATSSARVLVEAKSVSAPPSGGEFPESPHLYWILQCLLQCYVTGAPYAILAVAYMDTPEWEDRCVVAPVTPHWPKGRGDALRKECRGWAAFRKQRGLPLDVAQLYTITAMPEFGAAVFGTLAALRGIAMNVALGHLSPTVAAVGEHINEVLSVDCMARLKAAAVCCTPGISDALETHLSAACIDTDTTIIPVPVS